MSNTNTGDKPENMYEYYTERGTIVRCKSPKGDDAIICILASGLNSDDENIELANTFSFAGNLSQKYGSLEALEKRMIEAERKQNNHFEHLMEYMRAIEDVIGFAGPVERAAEELLKIKSANSQLENRVKELEDVLHKLKPLYDGRKNEFERMINELLTPKQQ